MSILIPGKIPKQKSIFIEITPGGGVNEIINPLLSVSIGLATELPPHGRLIDADALKVYQMEENVRADGDPNEYEYDAGLIDGLHMAAKAVSVAPTVIPADPEKEDT